MTESYESRGDIDELREIRGELDALSLEIKKDSFKAQQILKNKVKDLGFYNGDENGENIRFNIANVKKYLEGIKDKSWTELDVKSSELDKGVRTIAIQIAINYINMKNGESNNKINWIDGIRGRNTWEGVKNFQVTYNLKNKDGLPGRETINMILNLLGTKYGNDIKHEQGLGKKEDVQSPDKNKENKENEANKEDKETEKTFNNEAVQNNVNDSKCVNLFGNLQVNSKAGEMVDEGNSFKNKLNDKFKDNKGLAGILFKNPQIQNLLASITSRQGKEINNMKIKHAQKKALENNNKAGTEVKQEGNKENVEPVQTWEDYKSEKFSKESFEDFILSDEGIAIIMNEIKSHIDTNHKNENGEYDKFYENYPISEKSLELKLKNAWEIKKQLDYYNENGIETEKGERLDKIKVILNNIVGGVDEIVGEHMKSGNEDFDQSIISNLGGLLSEGFNGVPINEILSSDEDYKDTFKLALESMIKKYGEAVLDKDYNILDTGDRQMNFQLKSYLYIYLRIFHSQSFERYKNIPHEELLAGLMKSVMINDGALLRNMSDTYGFLATEKKLEEKRKINDFNRRQRAAKNREINNRSSHVMKGKETTDTTSTSNDSMTGEQLVSKYVSLDDRGPNIADLSKLVDTPQAKQRAFLMAWEKLKQYDIIKETITPVVMRSLFNITEGSGISGINEIARNKFLEDDAMKGRDQEEIDNIYSILKSFPTEYNNSLKRIASGINKQEEFLDKRIKDSALGSVIDNIRDIFYDTTNKLEGNLNFEGFKLSETIPVIREGNNIIISGTFNGSIVKIRYDLDSGALFMNSFLQHTYNPPKIVIGNNAEANIKIGELEPFDNILEEHYKAPEISLNNNSTLPYRTKPNSGQNQGGDNSINEESNSKPQNSIPQTSRPRFYRKRENAKNQREDIKNKYMAMLNEKLDVIGEAISYNTNKQSVMNSVIVKFMKTFNVINENQEDKALEFNDSSNLFDFLQIIENSDPIALEYFQLLMEKISDFAGLKWGSNNIHGSQKVFEENYNNESMNLVKENIKSFSNNPDKFINNSIINFTSEHQLGFVQMIKEKLTEGIGPDMKLDSSKIDNFIKEMNRDS